MRKVERKVLPSQEKRKEEVTLTFLCAATNNGHLGQNKAWSWYLVLPTPLFIRITRNTKRCGRVLQISVGDPPRRNTMSLMRSKPIIRLPIISTSGWQNKINAVFWGFGCYPNPKFGYFGAHNIASSNIFNRCGSSSRLVKNHTLARGALFVFLMMTRLTLR